MTDPAGLKPTVQLSDEEGTVYNATDDHRLDGRTDLVCCSVQYPNPFYFQTARGRDNIFRDWCVLLLRPDLIWSNGAHFCPRNAASGRGVFIQPGIDGFEAMFAETVRGRHVFNRTGSHRSWQTTDQQAEVLIRGPIPKTDIIGIVVASTSQARRLLAMADTLEVGLPPLTVSPDFFDSGGLSGLLRSGRTPDEQPFESE